MRERFRVEGRGPVSHAQIFTQRAQTTASSLISVSPAGTPARRSAAPAPCNRVADWCTGGRTTPRRERTEATVVPHVALASGRTGTACSANDLAPDRSRFVDASRDPEGRRPASPSVKVPSRPRDSLRRDPRCRNTHGSGSPCPARQPSRAIGGFVAFLNLRSNCPWQAPTRIDMVASIDAERCDAPNGGEVGSTTAMSGTVGRINSFGAASGQRA